MIDKDKLISLLISKEIPVKKTQRYKTIGYRIKLESGTAVYVYDSGGFFCQGNNADQVRKAIEHEIIDEPNKKVFVVYGHDKTARNQLQRLLEELNLEPIFLDNQPIGGRTVIEQLMEYIPCANFGIVLMTPDDIGCPKNEQDQPQPRARQNVVLELGMLLMKFGRSRTAILLKEADPPIEKPSDINGILYLPYKDDVFEIKQKLIREMNSKGYEMEQSK